MIEKKIISKCSELMMDKFIDCLINKNYSCLVLSGEYLPKELYANWNNIFYEYCDLENSNNTKLYKKYIKLIAKGEEKMTVINICLIVLSHFYNQDCVDLLKKYGYNYDFNYEDKESFLSNLQNVQNTIKMAAINLQNDQRQLEKIINKKQNVIKESDFNTSFVLLSKFMGYPVKKQNTSVAEYCSMINLINKK